MRYSASLGLGDAGVSGEGVTISFPASARELFFERRETKRIRRAIIWANPRTVKTGTYPVASMNRPASRVEIMPPTLPPMAESASKVAA